MLGWMAAIAASASSLVLYSGEDSDAGISRVVAAADVPVEDLTATSLRELVGAQPPVLRGEGQLRPCVGPPSDLRMR